MSDPDFRSLFEDAVADVEPAPALDRIRARTESRRPRWYAVAGLAAAATVLATAGVVALTRDSTSGDGTGPVGQPSLSPSATASPSEPAGSPSTSPTGSLMPVYFLGETPMGPRLYREFVRNIDPGLDPTPGETAVAAALIRQPTDPDYSNPWPADMAVSVTPTADLVTIDLTNPTTNLVERPAGMAEQTAELAVQQLVYTVHAALQARPPVQFIVDGQRVPTLLGVPVSEPLANADELQTLASTWIIDPASGAEVDSPFTVSGVAAAFEATVEWELLDETGEVVDEGFATAQECCTRSPYSFEVTAPPGTYTIVVRGSDPSGGEGPGPTEDTKVVTVR